MPLRTLLGIITGHRKVRHGTDTGQRLAAKTKAPHLLQLLQGADLARGVTVQRERQIFSTDTQAIVADANQLCAGGLDVNIHSGGAGIETVFQQLLDHRCRALDDLAGGNLIGEARGKALDKRHKVYCSIQLAGMRRVCPTRILLLFKALYCLSNATVTLKRWAMPDSVSPRTMVYSRSPASRW